MEIRITNGKVTSVAQPSTDAAGAGRNAADPAWLAGIARWKALSLGAGRQIEPAPWLAIFDNDQPAPRPDRIRHSCIARRRHTAFATMNMIGKAQQRTLAHGPVHPFKCRGRWNGGNGEAGDQHAAGKRTQNGHEKLHAKQAKPNLANCVK